MFSRKKVLELEDVIQDKVAKISKGLETGLKSGDPSGVDLYYGFRAVSVDVITDYAFNDCCNLVSNLVDVIYLQKHDRTYERLAKRSRENGCNWNFTS